MVYTLEDLKYRFYSTDIDKINNFKYKHIILQTIDEKKEIYKIKTMNIANYLKCFEVYYTFCNKDK